MAEDGSQSGWDMRQEYTRTLRLLLDAELEATMARNYVQLTQILNAINRELRPMMTEAEAEKIDKLLEKTNVAETGLRLRRMGPIKATKPFTELGIAFREVMHRAKLLVPPNRERHRVA